jgi:DNA adenine methylase
MKYPGGKNGSGVYQRLISMMPPHDVYIELFLGSGAVMRRKRPALVRSIGYELNPKTIAEFATHIPDGFDTIDVHQADALEAVRNKYSASSAFWLQNDPARTLIYADPPYLQSSRKSKARIYQFEMFERSEHIELLDLLAAVPARVMISGYSNPLYNAKLRHWRREEIPTTNRAGQRVIEIVWLNFPEPFELHDYEHVGTDFRDRWRIEKRRRNWRKNWLAMPPLERYAILGCIEQARREHAAGEAEQTAQAALDRQRIAVRRDRQNRRPDPATTKTALAAEPRSLFE